MLNSLKNRLAKLECKTMTSSIYETLLDKNCRKDKWGVPEDKGAQIYVVMAMAIKDYAEYPNYDAALSVLKWASTVPELGLIERAERIWNDYVSAGIFPVKPSPWDHDTVDTDDVMPPLPWYCNHDQITKFRPSTLFDR